jgi:hypothetical protein
VNWRRVSPMSPHYLIEFVREGPTLNPRRTLRLFAGLKRRGNNPVVVDGVPESAILGIQVGARLTISPGFVGAKPIPIHFIGEPLRAMATPSKIAPVTRRSRVRVPSSAPLKAAGNGRFLNVMTARRRRRRSRGSAWCLSRSRRNLTDVYEWWWRANARTRHVLRMQSDGTRLNWHRGRPEGSDLHPRP